MQYLVDASLSSSEETIFGQFLEGLAIYVNTLAYGGQKSSATGIDLEFTVDDTRYIVAIKSGPNWGNSSQHTALRANFKTAIRVLRQSKGVRHVQPVLGTCYGRSSHTDTGEYLKLSGQRFWTFISGVPTLYIDIIEPLGHRAKAQNERFLEEKAHSLNRLMRQFIMDFCDESGRIDWPHLVAFNSGEEDA